LVTIILLPFVERPCTRRCPGRRARGIFVAVIPLDVIITHITLVLVVRIIFIVPIAAALLLIPSLARPSPSFIVECWRQGRHLGRTNKLSGVLLNARNGIPSISVRKLRWKAE
jgi:hypothetical protein